MQGVNCHCGILVSVYFLQCFYLINYIDF